MQTTRGYTSPMAGVTPTIGLVRSVILLALIGTLFSCKREEMSEETPEDTSLTAGGGVAGVVSGRGRFVRIAFRIRDARTDAAGLALTDTATAYTVQLAGCASGYAATINEVYPSITVYKDDFGCRARLLDFDLGGRHYVPTIMDPFTTWNVGDVAVFDEVGEPGTHKLGVRVVSQLSDPVTGTEVVEYGLSSFVAGNDKEAEVPPLALTGATCCTTNSLKANAVELKLTAYLTAYYANIKIVRNAGAVAPAAADCSDGTPVTTLTSWGAPDTFYTDDTGVAGGTFSYRACAFAAGNVLIESATTTSLTSSKFHWVFVRSNANSNGAFTSGTADANCQTAGNAIDNTLDWVALLSTSEMEAAGRIPIAGTVYNRPATGAPVQIATGYAGLWGGSLAAGIRYDESGAVQSGSVWTGATAAGGRAATSCTNWTASGAGVTGGHGTVNSATNTWVTAGTTACNSALLRTLCVSKAIEPLVHFSAAAPGSGTAGDVAVDIAFPTDVNGWTKVEVRRALGPTAPSCSGGTLVKTYNGPTFTSEIYTDATGVAGAYYSYTACLYSGASVIATSTTAFPARAYRATTAHTIFVTSTATYNGNQTGFTNMDLACETHGDKLNPAKTWIAVASTATVAAYSAGRVNASTHIRNVAGGLVATNAADLFDGTLSTGITYDEMATNVGAASVWTGTTSAGAANVDHCSSWTRNNNGTRGAMGVANATGGTWMEPAGANDRCNLTKRFYCYSTTAD